MAPDRNHVLRRDRKADRASPLHVTLRPGTTRFRQTHNRFHLPRLGPREDVILLSVSDSELSLCWHNLCSSSDNERENSLPTPDSAPAEGPARPPCPFAQQPDWRTIEDRQHDIARTLMARRFERDSSCSRCSLDFVRPNTSAPRPEARPSPGDVWRCYDRRCRLYTVSGCT